MDNIFFGKNLKYLRKKKGLTQSEILNGIGFKRTTWNMYENQKSFPKFEDLIKISKYFDVSLSQLVEFDLLEGGDLQKNNFAKNSRKGGDLGGDLGGDAQKKGNNWSLNDSQTIYNTNYNNLLKEIELKDSVIEALRGQIAALKDSNATLNSLIREMGKDDDISQKRSAAG
ncbi:helix-turn-helix domain-containing protein [Ferruginibacter yonginensis]|uniref:Helix-turn-helix domain-containing protein n=1 Tax=Ferruginibacter yonginensis TaxID=1310416 RepID=A0ABV8QRJ2_9BACT